MTAERELREEVKAGVDRAIDRSASYPLTEQALKQVQSSVNDYIRELLLESARTARRHQSQEAVESTDVLQAARYLTSASARRGGEIVGIIGGLLTGGALGNLLAVATTEGDVALLGVVLSVASLLIGAIMVTYQVARGR